MIDGLEEFLRMVSAGDDIRCTCGSTELLKGPRGGLAINLKCAKCGKVWWYAPGFGLREVRGSGSSRAPPDFQGNFGIRTVAGEGARKEDRMGKEKAIEIAREIYPVALAGFCTICGKPKGKSRRLLTCSEECHERLVERLVRKFGKFKRVVDAKTGKAHKVPTRRIIESGLKHEDLAKYPLWGE